MPGGPLMRPDLRIPPTPDRLIAPACSADAIARREAFVRAAAAAWSRAGDAVAASRLEAAADALASRAVGRRD